MSEQTHEKKESDEMVTKGYLDEKLDEKLEDFVTKDYLDERLGMTQSHLDERLDQFKDEIREDMREQTATLLQAVDKVMTRYDSAEKDQAGHNALHRRITDDIHEHDDRIKKLEIATG